MASINQVTILGNLGKDPDVRELDDGTLVATLNVATSKRWKDKEGAEREKTCWHRCVLWGGDAKWVRDNKRKGDQIMVVGYLETREYDEDGQRKWITEVVGRQWDPFGGAIATYGTAPIKQPHPADDPSFRERHNVKRKAAPDGTVGGKQTVGEPPVDERDSWTPNDDERENMPGRY